MQYKSLIESDNVLQYGIISYELYTHFSRWHLSAKASTVIKM